MRGARVLVAVVAACLVLPSLATATNIRVESTTDTVDAGLVEGLLRNAYLAAQPGDKILYHAVGTGAALTNARNGAADVVITHAPSLEAQFVADGFAVGDKGRQIFYSDYVIVGPLDDPAGVIANGHQHDAIGALEDIAHAGDADPTGIRFNTRFDNSGTNVQEQIMWGMTDNSVAKVPSHNNSGNTTRFEPGTQATPADPIVYPAWYKDTNAGQGINLNMTETCAADGVAPDGCYTMLDRGTFNKGINDGSITHLKIVSELNSPTARGGENLLINPFSVYIVNPAKIATTPKPDVAAATRFVNFLTSPGFQAAVAGFPTSLDPAFRPDAFPALTVTQALPQTAAAGGTVTVGGTAANRLPGAAALIGLPVVLQRSTNGGASWSDVGGPATVGANGRWSLSTVVSQTARYRLRTPTFDVTSYNSLSPSTQELGPVTVPATAPQPDTKAPSVTRVKLTRRGVSLRVSEGSDVRLVIQKRVRNRFRTISRLHLGTTKARTLRGHHKALGKGRYRIKITVTDAVGNRRTLTRSFRRH
jgi:tungstate transport system substrate-binding protein